MTTVDPLAETSGPTTAERHLRALRSLLRRDLLSGASWNSALRDTAAITREALEGDEALVALWHPATATWSATTSGGHELAGPVIRLMAPMSLLDAVRTSGEAILTTASLPMLERSPSVARHDVRSVLVMPIRIRSLEAGREPRLGGCIYVDRRGDSPPFTAADVELVRDLAALSERTLALLAHVDRVEGALAEVREALQDTRIEASLAYRQGHYDPADPGFVERVVQPLRRAAQASKVGVLLLGPTGVGKTHLAQAFHYTSGRRDGPFVVLDCGQVTSSEALGAELFGYARRSGFSAPPEGRAGKARLANGGTLFVDEVGSLPLDLQQRLLRLIQVGRFSPLGSAEEAEVDVQVVAAANQDLAALVREGRFREDLFWRLGELVVDVPPLDEHPADIPGLARTFLAAAATRFRRPALRSFSDAALHALAGHRWSRAGNVRGLEHTVNRSVLLAPDGVATLDAQHLAFGPLDGGPVARPAPAAAGRGAAVEARPAALDADVRAFVEAKLLEHGGKLAALAADTEVASLLGRSCPMPLSTLRLRLRRLGLAEIAAAARRPATLDDVVAAIERHGDGHSAAAALGLTRDQLAWRLRQAGLTIRGVLARAAGDGSDGNSP